jgi:hypothetical protein
MLTDVSNKPGGTIFMSPKSRSTQWLLAVCITCLNVSSALAKSDQIKHSQPPISNQQQNIADRTDNWHAREGVYFQRNWGVDIVGIKPVSSGYMLAFRYRVLDPKKAQALNNKKLRPYVIDQATGIRLAVPSLENIGELRQSAEPEANRTYYMIFGNPGKLVKSGSRVDVVIGDFRVNGLKVN